MLKKRKLKDGLTDEEIKEYKATFNRSKSTKQHLTGQRLQSNILQAKEYKATFNRSLLLANPIKLHKGTISLIRRSKAIVSSPQVNNDKWMHYCCVHVCFVPVRLVCDVVSTRFSNHMLYRPFYNCPILFSPWINCLSMGVD